MLIWGRTLPLTGALVGFFWTLVGIINSFNPDTSAWPPLLSCPLRSPLSSLLSQMWSCKHVFGALSSCGIAASAVLFYCVAGLAALSMVVTFIVGLYGTVGGTVYYVAKTAHAAQLADGGGRQRQRLNFQQQQQQQQRQRAAQQFGGGFSGGGGGGGYGGAGPHGGRQHYE